MKHLLAIIASLALLCGCSSDNDETPEEPDVFYIKYEVRMYVPKDCKMNIIYTAGTGKERKSLSIASSTWDGTYGPFKKGEVVTITASTTKANILSVNYARIYVSKNNSPYGIKSEVNNDYNTGVQTSYKLE